MTVLKATRRPRCAVGRGVAVCVLAAAFAGCTVTRAHRTPEALAAHRDEVVSDLIEGRERISRKVIGRVIQEQDRAAAAGSGEAVVDFLILSGGGDYGAFGAGVLKGWGTVTDPGMARPVFDVVSGVSTGALIAPLAFVGTEEAYETAFQVYQHPRREWTRTRGLLTSLITKASFADSGWLRREIERSLDHGIIRQIAAGHDDQRILLIGTTNVDLGMLVMWDGALIAHRIIEEDRPRARLDDVIMASASIPAVFPPVEIDGDLYVDGGVTRNIAYTTDFHSPVSAVQIWGREHAGRRFSRVRIWVIVNNQLGTPMRHVHPGWPSQIGRSLEISIRSSTISSLKALAIAAELIRLRGNTEIEYRYICIPEDWRPPVQGTFQRETMVSLAQLGYTLGADPASWKTAVPDPESPEVAEAHP